MKRLMPFDFDIRQCRTELSEFKALLGRKRALREHAEVLPFFRRRQHLAAFIGSYCSEIVTFDRLAFEYSLFGDFASDLVVGDSSKASYCFIEFEDGSDTSIFSKARHRCTLEWASRFEHGFSQIVDWMWKLDDMRGTTEFRSQFEADDITSYGILVLGRSEALSYREQRRLRWRVDRVLVDSKHVFCITFDELAEDLDKRLKGYVAAARLG